MPMIHAETMKAVQQLLQDRNIEHHPDESWGDYIARGLGISDAKAEAFLEALHAGYPVDAAKRAAGIADGTRAVRFAQVLGTTIGRIRRQIAPVKHAPIRRGRTRPGAIGATEDQVNMTLQVPQRIDDYGTRAEDVAGTGEHDSQGG